MTGQHQIPIDRHDAQTLPVRLVGDLDCSTPSTAVAHRDAREPAPH